MNAIIVQKKSLLQFNIDVNQRTSLVNFCSLTKD